MSHEPPNYRAALDAGSASCYICGVIGPARVSAGVLPVIPMTTRIEFKAPWAAVTPEEQERLEAELAREVWGEKAKGWRLKL